MQNSRVSLGDEDCAEGNNVDLSRATEVSVGAHRMLYSEMGHLESLHEKLETSREHVKELLQRMAELRELTKREHDLLTRELHTSTEARKQVSEMMSELRASAKEERESVMKELESYREARKQLSQEMIELRASMEREKELLTRELKAYKEGGKQGMNESAAVSPSNESDETDASSPTFFRKFTGLFVSSKSTRLRKHSQQKTQQKEFELATEASTERKKESLEKEQDNSGEVEKQLSEELNDSRDQFKGLMEEHESVKETENLGAASPSNECVEPDASRSTLFKKFKGLFVPSKSRRQRRYPNEKKQKELKVSTKGTQLLADPSHEDYRECRQGHNEITDIQDISGNDEVETGTFAFESDTPPRPRKKTKRRSTNDATNCSQDRESDNEGVSSGRCKANPSLVENTDSGQRYTKLMDSQNSSECDGEKQKSYEMISTSRAIDNHVRQNHFEAETSMQFNQTTDRRQSFHYERALQPFSGYYNACTCSYFIGPQIYADQLQCTGPGQLLPMRPSKSLPSLLCERDIIPPCDVIL